MLMHFPVDALKIDSSFIRGIGSNEDAEAITRAIVTLGQSLGIEIIADGVECIEQEMYLAGLGCATGQGFLCSKAVPAELVQPMLETRLTQSA